MGVAVGYPSVFWFVGGTDSDRGTSLPPRIAWSTDIPFNHSPGFAPVQHPTMETGIEAMVTAALCWLGPDATGRS